MQEIAYLFLSTILYVRSLMVYCEYTETEPKTGGMQNGQIR